MSSKRRIRRRSCENKQRHDTEAAAIAHAVSLRRQGRLAAVYACGDHWHVGRRPQRAKQAARDRLRNRERRA